MNSFKIMYGISFACSIALLVIAYSYFQEGDNLRALIYLAIGVVTGIANFKSLMED